MARPAKVVRFVIEIVYPSNADETDYDDMLDALIECASDTTGLGVDGEYGEVEKSDYF